jgi:hypothetical protein
METKVCSRCGFPKPIDDFSPHPQCKGGRRGTCKSCASAFSSDWQVTKKSSLRGRLRYLLSAVKSRARTKNLQFDLDLDYLAKQYEDQGGLCAVTRIGFNSDSDSRISPYALSIDRIKPKNGYIKGNVQFVLLAVNLAKNDWDLQELVPIWRAMLKGWLPCTQSSNLNRCN